MDTDDDVGALPWKFSQCFGEKTVVEEMTEGRSNNLWRLSFFYVKSFFKMFPGLSNDFGFAQERPPQISRVCSQ